MKPRAQKYRVGHGGYVSEFSQFINAFLEQHPEVVEDQRRGWYIWWDRQVDLHELEKAREDTVELPPYYYT